MSKIIHLFLVIFYINYLNIDAAQILGFFSVPSISHAKVFRPLTQELAKRGHQVTVITPDPEFSPGSRPSNLTEIDVHDLSYSIWRDKVLDLYHSHVIEQTSNIYQILNEIFIAQIKTNEVQKILSDKSVKYDVIHIESSIQMQVALSYIKNVPIIQISSLGACYDNHNIIGSPDDAIIYPHVFREKLFNLTFWQKVVEYNLHVTIMKNLARAEFVLDEMLKENFGADVPSLTDLRNNVEMLFINVNPLWDRRPVPPGVVFMGGMHLKDTEELPKDLKQYLDSSLNGVIYISFGSNIELSTLPAETVRVFLKVFSQKPYNILLKSDMDVLKGRSENVKLSKWFPQADLLRHPNIKLFITHGGLQSIDETISAEVPIVGIPLAADQNLNVELCVHYGVGVRLDLNLITEENLRTAIDTVILDKSYYSNIVKLRSWMNDQRQTPLERAMWWIEHVLRHGGARHLRSPAANMHWTEKLELNLFLQAFLTSLFLLAIFLFSNYYLIKTLFRIIKARFT